MDITINGTPVIIALQKDMQSLDLIAHKSRLYLSKDYKLFQSHINELIECLLTDINVSLLDLAIIQRISNKIHHQLHGDENNELVDSILEKIDLIKEDHFGDKTALTRRINTAFHSENEPHLTIVCERNIYDAIEIADVTLPKRELIKHKSLVRTIIEEETIDLIAVRSLIETLFDQLTSTNNTITLEIINEVIDFILSIVKHKL